MQTEKKVAEHKHRISISGAFEYKELGTAYAQSNKRHFLHSITHIYNLYRALTSHREREREIQRENAKRNE